MVTGLGSGVIWGVLKENPKPVHVFSLLLYIFSQREFPYKRTDPRVFLIL